MISVNINIREVLRYLGYTNQQLDTVTSNLINDSIEELKQLAEEKYIFKNFSIDRGADVILISSFRLTLSEGSLFLKEL